MEALHRERCSISRALCTYIQNSQKLGPPPGFLLRAPQKQMLCSQTLSLSLTVPGERAPPSRFPIRAPMDGDAHHQGLPYILLKIPNKGTSFQVPLEALQREMPIPRAFYTYHL
jgi:hypothetical protein